MATKSTEPIIGAHVNGGLKCTSKAVEIGAEAVQIFIGSPQTWRAPKPSPDEILDFKKEHLQNCLGPIFVHGNYLVNTASPDPVNYKRSVSNLHNALRMADAVGASGLIFHPGSTKDHPYDEAISRVVQSLTTVLEDYRG
ncbi:MAG: TIM barrel protein, partial [Cyanobacteria bacterium]|nr:TIM barrel protein [Cyanobacteriota bacterium]